MVVHEGSPVRKTRHELCALLNGAFDVQNQFRFRIVRLQGSDIIKQAAETLLFAVLAEIVLADSSSVVDLLVQISSLLNTQEGTDGLYELDGALLGDFVVLELDFAEEGIVHFVQNGHETIVAYVLLNLELSGIVHRIVPEHPVVDVVLDDFHLVSAETIVVVLPGQQLIEL